MNQNFTSTTLTDSRQAEATTVTRMIPAYVYATVLLTCASQWDCSGIFLVT